MTADPIALARSLPAPPLDARSRYLRRLTVDALIGGERGHIGSTMSLIEILRVLYDSVLSFRADEPNWPARDRCVLSKGHGCLALYAVLADKGFFETAALTDFCRHHSFLGGHPERGKVPGVEASTGALGHGLSLGVGMALAQRMRGRAARVFVIMGDGEINEGSVWEAAMSAAKHRLENLVAIVDYNKIQSAGPTAVIQELEPLADKWRAFGFETVEVNGHDVTALEEVLGALPRATGKPTAVICHTVKGKGIPFAEHDPGWHHKSKLPVEVHADLYAALEDA
ncbi:MAG: transketolase [Pseudomonadota bacterium]|nr:transketolase [Pseudomonadota bacterium]